MHSIRAQFAHHGLRCTRQREALFAALVRCKSHPTADELYQLARGGPIHLSLATVYNTLEALSKAGLCRKLPTTSGSIRYDADISDHAHVRLKDSGCIEDVPPDLGRKLIDNLPQRVLREIERRLSVRIDDVQVQLIGQRAVS